MREQHFGEDPQMSAFSNGAAAASSENIALPVEALYFW
jgi:hypothetical protein